MNKIVDLLFRSQKATKGTYMVVANKARKWTTRTKHLAWAFLFLVSYVIGSVAPFMPVYAASTPVISAANPSLIQACGLDIALVIDNSLSIDSTEMTQMKGALTSFVDALSGTPTEFSVTRFSTNAQVVQNFSSNTTTVKSAINSVSTSSGYTNWEDALIKVKSTLPNRANPNLVIFATDGDPTTSNTVGGLDINQPNDHLPPAIIAANTIKNGGTRILGLGIGLEGSSIDRLKSISGPNANTGSVLTSDVISSNFSTLATDLATFAKQTCGGTITVKKLIDADGNLQTTNDQAPASGWMFDVNGGSNPDATTTDANGLTPAVKVNAGTGYSVSEVSKPGYSVLEAGCTNATNNGSWSSDLTVNGIQVGTNDIINCTFINKLDTGKVRLVKEIDKTYGGTLGVNDFGLSIGGTPVSSDQELTVPAGTPVVINEAGAAGYQFVSITGEGCPTVLGGTVTPVKDKTITCTIKNASKPGTLIVKKVIHDENGGAKTFTDFSYSINGGNTITFEADGSNNNTLAAGTYTVVEPADSQYDTAYDNCTNVVLANGATATCTITNTAKPATLTLNKTVINQYGSNKSPSDFTPLLGGENVPSTIAWGQAITLKAGTYTAGEVNLPGFEGSGWTGDCAVDGKITLKIGDNKTCSITNTALPASITGKKNVSNTDLSWVTAGINPASGWTIFLDQNQNGMLDNGEVSTVTDVNGSYSFTGLGASMNYYVKEVIPALSGWEQITGVANPVVISTVGGSSTGNNFTNKAYGTITLTKQLNPANDPGKFNLLVGDLVKAANVGNGGTTGKVKVEAGTYSVSEVAGIDTDINDYNSKWVCMTNQRSEAGDGTLTTLIVKPGEDWACVFTNTRDTGIVTVVKDAQPDGAQSFNFTIAPLPDGSDEGDNRDRLAENSYQEGVQSAIIGDEDSHDNQEDSNQPIAFALTDNGTKDGKNIRSTVLPTGEYVISEASVDGWDLSNISCGDSDTSVSVEDGVVYVDVTKGANITCTFTNTQRTTLTIVKDAQPNVSKSFNFTSTILDQLGSETTFSLSDDGTNLTNSKKFENLKPGTYVVTETAADAWKLDNISCSGTGITMVRDGYKLTVTLAAGAVATCTFVNSFVPQVLGDATAAPTLVNTGTDTIIGATIAFILTTAAVAVVMQRRRTYATVTVERK